MADLKNGGTIDSAKGRIRSAWAELTDDDFQQAKGDVEELVGKIKEKTGESADEIRSTLSRLLEPSAEEHGHPHEPDGDGQVGGTHYAV